MVLIPVARGEGRMRLTREDAYVDELRSTNPCGHVRDCGCQGVAECCFKCPLPRCRYDGGGNGLRTIRNQLRDADIVRLSGEGVPIEDLMGGFFLGRRSVYRILQEAK